MAYSTSDDLVQMVSESVVLQLADDDGTAAGLTDPAVLANIESAIGQADNEIDGYLGTVMDLPLADVPGLITDISARIALYNLASRRPHLDIEAWEKQYNRVAKLLANIKNGSIHFGNETGQAEEPATNSIISHKPERLFGPEVWRKF